MEEEEKDTSEEVCIHIDANTQHTLPSTGSSSNHNGNAESADPTPHCGWGWVRKPVVMLPCGESNNIASHFGVSAPERGITSFVLARAEPLWVWEGHHFSLRKPTRQTNNDDEASNSSNNTDTSARRSFLFLSHVIFGVAAQERRAWEALRSEWNQLVALPSLGGGPERSVVGSEAAAYSAAAGVGRWCRAVLRRFTLAYTLWPPQALWARLLASTSSLLSWRGSESHRHAGEDQQGGLRACRGRRVGTTRYVYCDLTYRTAPRTGTADAVDADGEGRESSMPSVTAISSTAGKRHHSLEPPSPASTTSSSQSKSNNSNKNNSHTIKGGGYRTIIGPFVLLVLSTLPSQTSDCWLTPSARHRDGELSITLATAAATPFRIWHLLRREAPTGEITEEDGVQCLHRVVEARLRWWNAEEILMWESPTSPDARVTQDKDDDEEDQSSTTSPSRATAGAPEKTAPIATSTVDCVVDGEVLQLSVSPSSSMMLVVHRTPNYLNVCGC